MSLMAKYFEEREGFFIMETEEAFASYKITEEQCYIKDIYVLPEHRKDGIASNLADKIVEKAKRHGCTMLVGSVSPEANGATNSMKVLLCYGLKLSHINKDEGLIIMAKEI